MKSLSFRQVHLDFHTSEHCGNIGSAFDPDVFGETLKEAHVSSINLFSKCHHGYSYYPTKVGTIHPGLSFDLLGEQIEACHKRGILAPIYYSVMWDDLAGRLHPEWMIVDKSGKLVTRAPLSNEWGWATLDVSTSYADYVLAQVEELLRNYTVDGFWFDICFPLPNYSPWGKAQMQAAGIDVNNDRHVMTFAEKKQTEFFKRVTTFIESQNPAATIFYNGTMSRDMRRVSQYMTHFEVESLPTTGQWGYLHYPIVARQARRLHKEFLGMNGRFHTSWGDFGGIKTDDQLDYECGTILAAGGKISIGDQLHPSGKLDHAVYRLIGHTYQRISTLEPWLEDVIPAAEVAILATECATTEHSGIASYHRDTEGAAQMCLEMGIQFDVVDAQSNLNAYRVVVVPDTTVFDDTLQENIRAYLAVGGNVILSGTAGLDPASNKFQIDQIPVRYLGVSPTRPSYLRPGTGIVDSEKSALVHDYDYAFYDQAHLVEPYAGAVAYGELRRALFNRTWDHFMGHLHAPVGDSLNAPVMVLGDTNGGGHVLYLAAPLFGAYREHDYWAYRAMMQAMLTRLLPEPLLRPRAPGWVEFALMRQERTSDRPARSIIHIVCYHARRTSQQIPHVDQSWETANLGVEIRAEAAPNRVYLAPDRYDLNFTYSDGYISVDLPPVGVHTVLVIE